MQGFLQVLRRKSGVKYKCGGYLTLREMIAGGVIDVSSLKPAVDSITHTETEDKPNIIDNFLIGVLCREVCAFYKEGQEKREDEFKCGAYLTIKKLLETGLKEETLRRITQTLKKQKTNSRPLKS